MAVPMRIALVSYSAEGFAVLHETCGLVGHTPVVYLHARSLRPRTPSRPGAGATAGRIVDEAPPGMDLLLPGSPGHLADTLTSYQPDLLVCYGFPWRFRLDVLRVPRLGAMNVHTSLLPRYRGPLPVQWAIRNGDPEIGVTIHWMDEHLDTGNVIAQEGGIHLEDDVVGTRLWTDVNSHISRLLPLALERAADGFEGLPQDERLSSYAGWMEPEFSYVDWSHTAQQIHNQVRTLRFMSSGARGPRTCLDGEWIYAVRTSINPAEGREAACADGPIWITEWTPAPAPNPGEFPEST